jgi:hypothetical protein
MDIKDQILVALGLDKQVEVAMAWQAKTEDGTILTSTAEELEAGVDVSVLTEDGTTILLPIGTYKLDTGVSFRVEEEGVVAEVIESETEEVETEEVEEEEMAEEADVADWQGMEKRIENLEIAVADLKKDKDGGDDESEEMAEEVVAPSTLPKTITTKEVKEFSIEDLKAENEKLKLELAAQPSSAPLDTNKFSTETKKVSLSKRELSKMTKREQYLYNLYNN